MPSNFQPPASHTVTESMNVHAGETVRITVRNSGAAFYVTANGDEFLPFHTFGGSRDQIQCCNSKCMQSSGYINMEIMLNQDSLRTNLDS